jgi:hypothetical protein
MALRCMDEDGSLGWYARLLAITDQVYGSPGMFVRPGVLFFVFSVPHNRKPDRCKP